MEIDFQNEIINTKEKLTICNWSRGLGKTYTCAKIITENKPKYVLYKNGIRDSLRLLCEQIKNIKQNDKQILEVKSFYNNNDFTNKIIIKYIDNEKTTIILDNYDVEENGYYKDCAFDYILYDEELPCEINFKYRQLISFVTINNFYLKRIINVNAVGLKKGIKYGLFNEEQIKHIKNSINNNIFINEVDILNEYNDIFKEKTNTNIKESLNEKIIKELNDDIGSLLIKLKNASNSDYKMLINNLKETVRVKQDIEYQIKREEESRIDKNDKA